jgi:hypothetical protein
VFDTSPLGFLGGLPWADSPDVARFYEKRHADVLRAISQLNCSNDFKERNFASFKIKDLAGVEITSHVEMTKMASLSSRLGLLERRRAPPLNCS